MPVPLDEYPVHQVPLSMRYMESSDRNSYDRSYWNAQDRTGEVFLVTGLGVYPNLGVTDAYATIATPGRQVAVRMSDALGDDRLVQEVGPYKIEVIEPLKKLRLTCDAKEQGITFDLTWNASFPAHEEPRHQTRAGERDHPRRGPLRAGGHVGGLDEGRRPGVGGLARHLGRRPRPLVGHPAGRRAARRPVAPTRRPAAAASGGSTRRPASTTSSCSSSPRKTATATARINEAVRMWPDGRIEQLGWPEVEITYRSGHAPPERAVMHLRDENHKPFDVEFETLGYVAIGLGAGYGGDDWTHGRWMGEGWVDRVSYDLTDPEIARRASPSGCSTTSPRHALQRRRGLRPVRAHQRRAVTPRAASPTTDPSRPDPAVLSGEKILITGPAGQIAFPLAEYLAADNEVWGIARFGDPATRAAGRRPSA